MRTQYPRRSHATNPDRAYQATLRAVETLTGRTPADMPSGELALVETLAQLVRDYTTDTPAPVGPFEVWAEMRDGGSSGLATRDDRTATVAYVAAYERLRAIRGEQVVVWTADGACVYRGDWQR